MTETLEEYEERRCRNMRKPKRIHNSWGCAHAFKQERHLGWPHIGKTITQRLYSDIVNTFNKTLWEHLFNGETVYLPRQLGELNLTKSEPFIGIEDGKVVTTYPIDWNETMRVWREDEEMRREKKLIRKEVESLYIIKYGKHTSRFRNCRFYGLKPCRYLVNETGRRMERGELKAVITTR